MNISLECLLSTHSCHWRSGSFRPIPAISSWEEKWVEAVGRKRPARALRLHLNADVSANKAYPRDLHTPPFLPGRNNLARAI
jgi:hypothetical protein